MAIGECPADELLKIERAAVRFGRCRTREGLAIVEEDGRAVGPMAPFKKKSLILYKFSNNSLVLLV
jgi:hypothetical protein